MSSSKEKTQNPILPTDRLLRAVKARYLMTPCRPIPSRTAPIAITMRAGGTRRAVVEGRTVADVVGRRVIGAATAIGVEATVSTMTATNDGTVPKTRHRSGTMAGTGETAVGVNLRDTNIMTEIAAIAVISAALALCGCAAAARKSLTEPRFVV